MIAKAKSLRFEHSEHSRLPPVTNKAEKLAHIACICYATNQQTRGCAALQEPIFAPGISLSHGKSHEALLFVDQEKKTCGLGPIEDVFIAQFGGRRLDPPLWPHCAQPRFLRRG
jgi:hypothetical protein